MTVGVENAITIDGNTYTLLEVYEGFTYSPGINMGPGRVHWPTSETGQSILKDEAGTDIAAAARKGRKLCKILRNDTEVIVKADNDELLGELSYVLVMHNFVRQMQDLAVLMEIGAEALMTAAELIPGGGRRSRSRDSSRPPCCSSPVPNSKT